jgi:methyltransferase (TIGR00027 family)
MAPPESLTSLSRTALGMARVRAQESGRSDRLFDDPYAAAFLGAARDAFPEAQPFSKGMASVGAVFSFHGVIRTRFFDDYLLGATAMGCRQVVLLAAGLDSRAFRLAWPDGVRLFELDLDEVLSFKERVLAARHAVPRCQRTVLRADLREDWPAALTAAGFRPPEPTAWLAEGLLIYLSADEAAGMLTEVGELSAPASQLAFEHSPAAANPLLAQARALPSMRRLTDLWKGGLGARAPDWLARHGWRVQLHRRADLAAAYGRSTPEPSPGTGGFITAVREGAVEPGG